MSQVEASYEIREILADFCEDESEDGYYTYWEEYDTLRAGLSLIMVDEDAPLEDTVDKTIEDLKNSLVEKRFLTEEVANRAKFQTSDTGLSFDVLDWDWKPLYRLVLI